MIQLQGGTDHDETFDTCNECRRICEGDTYDDESPDEVAEQFNLEYIGSSETDIKAAKKAKQLGFAVKFHKDETAIYFFNDLETKSTLAVYDLSEVEDKITESRKKFKK